MRFVIQRVTEAAVRVDGELLGQIEKRIPGSDWCGRIRYGGNRR